MAADVERLFPGAPALAGDYMGLTTLESAIETGVWAADRVVELGR